MISMAFSFLLCVYVLLHIHNSYLYLCLNQVFALFVCLSPEIKLYMKSSRQAGMLLETIILRIQLYIPVFSLSRQKPLTAAMTTFVQ